MTASLTPLRHVCCALRIEKYHRLRSQRAALRGSERENVDARHPGCLRRRGVQARQRVAEARAIHVHRHSARVRDAGKLADFIGPIDRAHFSRL